MKIRNIGRKKEYEVYAISVSTEKDFSFKNRVIFYVAEEGMIGLGVEGLSDIEVIDNEIGHDFRFHLMSGGEGFLIMSGHFSDVTHLARLIDLDPQTLTAFEAARATRESRSSKKPR